ncbi:Phosphoribosylanthranilate isomerase [hydrothermal vent metagenome]|uniref:phosphoribosylanthranilate isomerase n=1 Tax=hydrothermal vent metagenome TaxID=652676 RepID=A0A3B0WL38_9ZZZZ
MQRSLKVKYCGLKTLDDVESAAEAQVDAIGLVFVENSPRYISPEDAIDLAAAAKHSGLLVVALFANHQAASVACVIQTIEPDVLQFHGNETVEFCEQFEHRYWKAIPMLETQNYQAYMAQYPKAEAFLLDAFGGQQAGGSGRSFKWFQFPEKLLPKLILAGGIHAENVTAAIAATGAQFIDTSSGIESTPGVKSKTKMLALVARVRTIDQPN